MSSSTTSAAADITIIPGVEQPSVDGRLRGTKVLAVHPFPDLYGSDLMLLRSLKALRGAGAAVALVVPEHGPLLARLEEEGLAYRVVASTVLRKSLLRPTALLRSGAGVAAEAVRIRRLLSKAGPDLVYVNTMTLPTWLLGARSAGIRTVCHVRELEEGLARPLARAVTAPLLAASQIVVNSLATRRFLCEQWPALEGRTSVVYNGLDFPPVQIDVTDRGEVRGGRSRIVVVGRLSPRKGQDVAVKAIARLVEQGLDVELDLVGDTFRGYEWYRRDLEHLARDAGIADRLHLRGYQEPVWDWYHHADVVAVPSRLEPFGNVAAESLALGRPVVVSDVGGLPEIVRDGTSGLVVPADDPAALARALRDLLTNPRVAAQLVRSGQRDVRERFSADGYGRRLVEAFAVPSDPQVTSSSAV